MSRASKSAFELRLEALPAALPGSPLLPAGALAPEFTAQRTFEPAIHLFEVLREFAPALQERYGASPVTLALWLGVAARPPIPLGTWDLGPSPTLLLAPGASLLALGRELGATDFTLWVQPRSGVPASELTRQLHRAAKPHRALYRRFPPPAGTLPRTWRGRLVLLLFTLLVLGFVATLLGGLLRLAGGGLADAGAVVTGQGLSGTVTLSSCHDVGSRSRPSYACPGEFVADSGSPRFEVRVLSATNLVPYDAPGPVKLSRSVGALSHVTYSSALGFFAQRFAALLLLLALTTALLRARLRYRFRRQPAFPLLPGESPRRPRLLLLTVLSLAPCLTLGALLAYLARP